jgi:hypothetical protein
MESSRPIKLPKTTTPQRAAAEVDIGASKDKVTITDTDKEYGVNGVKVTKAELALACQCGPDDRCWAPLFSVLGWPAGLRLCQHPGQPGHEMHDSPMHKFTPQQVVTVGTLIAAAKAAMTE